MKFGWTAPFGKFGGGGGKKPASQQDIIWRGRNGVESGTDNVVNDTVGTLSDANYAGNNVLSFNGTDTKIDTGYSLTSTTSFEFGVTITDYTTLQDVVISDYDSTGGSMIDVVSPNIRVVAITTGGTRIVTHPLASLPSFPYTASLRWENERLSLLINGSEVAGTTYTGETVVPSPQPSILIGAAYTNTGSINRYSDITANGAYVIDAGTDIIEYTIAEGIDSTVYNRVQNNYHGVITNGTWSTSDASIPHNIKNGFRCEQQFDLADIPEVNKFVDTEYVPV
jgi:hypothetical protein